MQVFKLQDHTCNWKGPCALHESDWNLEILADVDQNIFMSKFSPVVTVVIARSAISSTRNDGVVEIKSDTPTSKISNSVEGFAFSDDGQVRVEVIWVLNFVAIIRVFRKTIFWSGKSWGIRDLIPEWNLFDGVGESRDSGWRFLVQVELLLVLFWCPLWL